ncbi:protein SDA1 homolog isoform X2 [Chelonus insularis]|nr:protein SDA1 homolog isoform X2 [Chelonus insularis]
MRMIFCKALILLRSKNLIDPTALLSLFFELLNCEDKSLRQFLRDHIINDIKNVNVKHKNMKVNTALQNFMFKELQNSSARAAKMAADIMIELYNKNIWNDAKTVNVIATGCFSRSNVKIMVACLKFFLGKDPDEKNSDDSDSDDDVPDLKKVLLANKFNKKSKKRDKELKKAKQLMVKTKKKKSKAPQFNFSALHLIYDPQDFAEKLFKQVEKNNDRFEVKLMSLDVVSRLIGIHNLLILNFYPYIQRFLQPHQREVTKLLQFVAQASHELVPPENLTPVLMTLANNFVTERNSSDVMAIGLNAIREMCSRCPLVMNEDLLQDLTMYKNYRERSVMMAARSLISLYRNVMPEMLHKKDRGRPTEATIALEPLKYGEVDVKDFVPGAETLLNASKNDDIEIDSENTEDDDDEWIDVSGSEDENDDASEDDGDDDDDDGDQNEEKGDENEVDEQKGGVKKRMKKQKRTKLDRKREKMQRLLRMKKVKKEEFTAEKKEKAALISVERLLTDEDFKKIDSALIKQQVTPHAAKRGIKRPFANEEKDELVKLGDIENIYKKRKHDKQARMESIEKGREDRVKFGYKDGRQNPLCSKTNREKKKTKAYQMVKHKIKTKVKRSFKDKQIALRNHLLKIKRMK